MKELTTVRRMTECAIMIALGAVLSFVKLADLPAGGSITLGSMLPIVLVGYRHGWRWGTLAGVVHGTIQLLTGMSVFGYVTSWRAAVAVVLLDYIVAFGAVGFAGVFRRGGRDDARSLILGAALSAVIRYICHVISGATVWAGLSIPTEAALWYSLAYNATYMIPETIVLVALAAYVGGSLTLGSDEITRRVRKKARFRWQTLAAGAILVAAVTFDTVAVFSRLQGADGTFDITLLGDVNWILVAAVTGGAILAVGFLLIGKYVRGNATH